MTNQTPPPDIFGNVHKGIRKALCEACVALGSAPEEPAESREARAILADALRFVAHHGENEDLLLLPLLDARAKGVAEALRCAHQSFEHEHAWLVGALSSGSTTELYARACAFLAAYFVHMHQEEYVHQSAIREALSVEELIGFGQKSVQRTSPEDQRMMLGYMLGAMTPVDAAALRARLPPQALAQL